MSAQLCEEHRQVQDLVARFVDKELMPLEPRIIEREIRGEHPTLTRRRQLQSSQNAGNWACGLSTCRKSLAASIFRQWR